MVREGDYQVHWLVEDMTAMDPESQINWTRKYRSSVDNRYSQIAAQKRLATKPTHRNPAYVQENKSQPHPTP
ncbi:hypothetical protein VTN49DRAFT_6212 [Thermomyces lanuginosus]|uniref:uncharacterized protein n=1 Tax=Thermomyces lanuginosus TaxID=5541 RepID=UPI003743BC2D